MSSHLGQSIQDHVTLVDREHPGADECVTNSFENRALFRVSPEGKVDAKPFSVPKGRLLVVTDVEWAAYGGVSGTIDLKANRTLTLTIQVGNAADTSQNPVVFTSSVTLDQAAAAGRPGRSEYCTAGFVVAAGRRICPSVAALEPSGFWSAYIDRIILRGYLIDAK